MKAFRLIYLDYVLNWRKPAKGQLFKGSSIPHLLYPTDHYRALHSELKGLLRQPWARRYVLLSIRARQTLKRMRRG
jgi:hypothetical protein